MSHLDTVLAAEVLVDGAVNIGDESGLRVLRKGVRGQPLSRDKGELDDLGVLAADIEANDARQRTLNSSMSWSQAGFMDLQCPHHCERRIRRQGQAEDGEFDAL